MIYDFRLTIYFSECSVLSEARRICVHQRLSAALVIDYLRFTIII
jgi:hypothetical protein